MSIEFHTRRSEADSIINALIILAEDHLILDIAAALYNPDVSEEGKRVMLTAEDQMRRITEITRLYYN